MKSRVKQTKTKVMAMLATDLLNQSASIDIECSMYQVFSKSQVKKYFGK
jgi:hypothetical protein